MNKKTTKLLTSLAVGVAAYYIYNQFVAPKSSIAGLGKHGRERRRGTAPSDQQGYLPSPDTFSGGYNGYSMPDTFSNGYGGYGEPYGRYGNWGNSYDPSITEQPGGIAATNAMLDAMESGN